MDIFRRRPLMLCCACFLAVSAISFFLAGWVKLVFIITVSLAAAVGIILLISLRKRETRIKLAVALVALLFSVAAAGESYLYFDIYAKKNYQSSVKSCNITAVVLREERTSAYDASYIISLDYISGEKADGIAVLYCAYPAGLKPGAHISIVAERVELAEVSFDNASRLRYMSDGVSTAYMVAESETSGLVYNGIETRITDFSRDINHRLSTLLENGIGGEEGRLASAVLLGNRDALSSQTVRDFARSGISHLLALSGMHMAILTGFFEFFLRRAGVPKLVRCCLMPAVMLGYLFLMSGFSLPALRAAVMLTVVYLSFVSAIPSDIMTTLFAVCAGIVAVMPFSATDVGFWMSFLATFGLIIASQYTSKLFKAKNDTVHILTWFKKALRYLCGAVVVTVVAVFSVIFLTWLCFGELSLASPLTNLAAAPATMLLMITSLLYIVFGGIPFVGTVLSRAAGLIGSFMLKLTSYISGLRGVTVSLEYDFAAVIVVLFCVAVTVLLIVRLKHKIFILIPPAVAVIAFAVCFAVTSAVNADRAGLTYLQRGEREMLLMTNGGRAVLCDLADGNFANYTAAWKVATEKECVTELEGLLLTHYHDKYRVAAVRLMSSVRVRSVWLPEPMNSEEYLIAADIAKTAEDYGVVCYIYSPDEPLVLPVDFTVIMLPKMTLERSVQPSLAMVFSFGQSCAVYVGSAYQEAGGTVPGELTDKAGTVIYGTHGPNPEADYDISCSINADELLFADKALLDLAYSDNALPTGIAVTYGCEYKRFVMERNN